MKYSIVLILSLVALCFCASQSAPACSVADGGKRYQCPMKCEGAKTYDAPGTCPVCKMDLQEVKLTPEADRATPADDDTVKAVGAMMNVMHKGELFGTIDLDTISRREHLYGLGPVEYLLGEITIIDGSAYVSRVVSPTEMKVVESYKVKAPFFVYAHVDRWKEVAVPEDVTTASQLEKYLDTIQKDELRPFAFKVSGTVKNASIHVVNLPKGTKVASPEDAHLGEQKYTLRDRDVDLVGFFSRMHKGVFTHHDTYVHMHLMTADKKMMGHPDEVEFVKGKIRLFLSER